MQKTLETETRRLFHLLDELTGGAPIDLFANADEDNAVAQEFTDLLQTLREQARH